MNIPKVCERCGAEIKSRRKFCSRCITIISCEKTIPQEIQDYLKEKELRRKRMANICRKRYREKHPKRIKQQRRSYKSHMKRRYHNLRLEVLSHYSGTPPFCACRGCNESHIEFLCIDHIKGGGTALRKLDGKHKNLYEWLKKNEFPEGFRVLCYNCNNAEAHGICPHQLEVKIIK